MVNNLCIGPVARNIYSYETKFDFSVSIVIWINDGIKPSSFISLQLAPHKWNIKTKTKIYKYETNDNKDLKVYSVLQCMHVNNGMLNHLERSMQHLLVHVRSLSMLLQPKVHSEVTSNGK